ncbi:UPF0145 domain protein [Sarocladium strictum]
MSKSTATQPNKEDLNGLSCFSDTNGIMTSTTNDIAGHHITKQLGTVYGLTVQARNWGVDLGAVLKNKAMDRMVGECMARGGNAVLAVRFDVVAMGALTQVCAYGTAAVVEEDSESEKGKKT